MKNKFFGFILISFLILFFPYCVSAQIKMKCQYTGNMSANGILGGVDNFKVSVVFSLDSDGNTATPSASIVIADDTFNTFSTVYDKCGNGKALGPCIQQIVNKNRLDEKFLITFTDNHIIVGEQGAEIIQGIKIGNNKYVELDSVELTTYFVENNFYSCPDNIMLLRRNEYDTTNGDNNYEFYVTKENFDSSKCPIADSNYTCTNPSTFELETRVLESRYDGALINNESNSCCAYTNPNTTMHFLEANTLYVYTYGQSISGNKSYAACLGQNCMTLSPTTNMIINDSSWSSAGFHNVHECSNMPEKIYFNYDGETYERVLNTGINCTAPSTEPSNLNTTYSSAVFYPDEESARRYVDSIDWGDKASVNCKGIIGQDMLDFINKIFKWIRILAPIIVILLSSVEFAGALLQDDRDSLKKATNRFIKRLIIAVALFFVPLILEFILNVFNEITKAKVSTCGIGS